MKTGKVSLVTLVIACGMTVGPLKGEKAVSWNVTDGDLGEAANWSPETAPELSALYRWEIRNGGVARVSAGQTCGFGQDLLIALGNGNGSLVLAGDGSLTIKRYLSIGHSGDGTGQVTLNDTASIAIEDGTLLVGQRSHGILSIASGASLILQKGSAKIGEGRSGTVNLSGTLEMPVLNFGSTLETDSEQNSTLKFAAGAKLRVSKAIVFNAGGKHQVEISGSGGEFSGGSLKAHGKTATFRFEPDAQGVTPVKITGLLDVTNAILEVNLDSFVFKSSAQKVVLFESDSRMGEFSEVKWLGRKHGQLHYDKKKGSIWLTDGK